jgi:hypothetical protein
MTEEKAPMVPPELVDKARSSQRAARPEDSQALIPVSAYGGLMPLSFAESLQELSQIKGEAVMALLCTHANRLENDLRDVRAEEQRRPKRPRRGCGVTTAKRSETPSWRRIGEESHASKVCKSLLES